MESPGTCFVGREFVAVSRGPCLRSWYLFCVEGVHGGVQLLIEKTLGNLIDGCLIKQNLNEKIYTLDAVIHKSDFCALAFTFILCVLT